jgi:type I restriction enzyme S subunit
MDGVASQTGQVICTRRSGDMKSAAARFYQLDVLYGRLRPYLNKVVCANFSGLASAEFIVLPGNAAVDPRFLAHRLRASDFVSFSSRLNEGDRPRVNFDQIGEFSLLLPPVNEQRRIVAKIEELFSELDQGVESLNTARAQLKTHRQSLLKAAFEGRLTEEWRRDNADKLEAADQLLQRIGEEREACYQQQLEEWKASVAEWESNGRQEKKPRKPARVKPPTPDEKDYRPKKLLPKAWSDMHLGELALEISQGWSPKCEGYPSRDDEEWGVIKTTAVQPMRFYYWENKALPHNLEPRPELELCAGDVLVTRAGPRSRVGVSCQVPEVREKLMVCDKVYRLRFPNRAIDASYIEFALNSPAIVDELEKLKSGINDSGVNLTQARFMKLRIPVAPFEEQEQISHLLDVHIATILEIEAAIDSALQRNETLRQSILKRAFEGKLVPQNPDDEPASALLERIRQEQADAPTPKRRKRKMKASA